MCGGDKHRSSSAMNLPWQPRDKNDVTYNGFLRRPKGTKGEGIPGATRVGKLGTRVGWEGHLDSPRASAGTIKLTVLWCLLLCAISFISVCFCKIMWNLLRRDNKNTANKLGVLGRTMASTNTGPIAPRFAPSTALPKEQ